MLVSAKKSSRLRRRQTSASVLASARVQPGAGMPPRSRQCTAASECDVGCRSFTLCGYALISRAHSVVILIVTTAFLMFTLSDAALSPCDEFSSSYSQQLRTMQLPVAAIEAAAIHASSECQHGGSHFFTRSYSMIYRWCSSSGSFHSTAQRCGADWYLVAGLHRIDSLQALLLHANRYQQRVLQTSGNSGRRRALIYKPSARGEGWGNRVMALTAAYVAALLSRRSFHIMFDRDDGVLSAIDFESFPPYTILGTSSAQRSFPCLSFAAAIEDPPLNFVRPSARRTGESISWMRSVILSGLDDEVAWLGHLDGARARKVGCAGATSMLYVSGAPAMHHSRDKLLRVTDHDHGGVWGAASIVVYSSYDSFWGALLDRPATGMLLKRLLLPQSLGAAADVGWAAARAHLRAWLAFGAFASAVIAPSKRIAAVTVKGLASPSGGGSGTSPHCSLISCAQCLGVAVRRGPPWNSDWPIDDDSAQSRMLACARLWLRNATEDNSSAARGACAFVAADDPQVLQRWIKNLTQDGVHVAFTPGSDGSHTGTQHIARTGTPPLQSVYLSYRDWFTLACCSRDAVLSDKSSFGYSAIALAVQRWMRDGSASLDDVMPLMLQPPPESACARRLWEGHMCPAPSPSKTGMIPC